MLYLALGSFLPLFFYHPSLLAHSLFSSLLFSLRFTHFCFPLSFSFIYFPLFPFSFSISLFLHLSHHSLSLFFNPLLFSLSRISLWFCVNVYYTYIYIYTYFVLSCTDYGIVFSVFLLRSSSRPMHLSSRLRGSHLVYKRVFSFLDPRRILLAFALLYLSGQFRAAYRL